MKVYIGNTIIECTPGEYIELQQKGVFSQSEPQQGQSTEQTYKDWFKHGVTDVVAVYGVNTLDNPTCDTTLPLTKGNIGPDSVLHLDKV